MKDKDAFESILFHLFRRLYFLKLKSDINLTGGKRMKNYLFLAAGFLCLAVAGCNTTGTPVEYSKACAAENDKKTIEISGFLSPRRSVFCSNTGGGPVRCGVNLLETVDSAKDNLSADIERG